MNRSKVKLMQQHKEDALVYKELLEIYKARIKQLSKLMRDKTEEDKSEEIENELYELDMYDIELERAIRDKIIQSIKKGD